MKLPHALRALAHRNFRLLLAGQGTSHVGNWVQLIATSWLMYQITGSTFMLGVASFALYGPLLLIAPFAGVLLDRVDVRKVLIGTNLVALFQAVVMTMLVVSNGLQAWHIVAGNLVFGFVSACDMPARQSLLPKLVGSRDDLSSAIAINSAIMNGARALGPAVGGIAIGAVGDAFGFGLNVLLRGAGLSTLLLIRMPSSSKPRLRGGWTSQFLEGVRYAFGFLPSRSALLLLAATSVTVQSYTTLMPWFAKDRFHGDSHTLGVLLGIAGVGSVAGLTYLAARPTVSGLFSSIARSSMLAGIALIAFSLSQHFWLGAVMIFLVGVGMTLTAASTNTVLQTIVPDELRGRIASIYVMAYLGVSPLGAIAGGWLAERTGPPAALMASGILTLVCAFAYSSQLPAIRTAIWPVYARLGILKH